MSTADEFKKMMRDYHEPVDAAEYWDKVLPEADEEETSTPTSPDASLSSPKAAGKAALPPLRVTTIPTRIKGQPVGPGSRDRT